MTRTEITREFDADGNETLEIIEHTYMTSDSWWVTDITRTERTFDSDSNCIREVETFECVRVEDQARNAEPADAS